MIIKQFLYHFTFVFFISISLSAYSEDPYQFDTQKEVILSTSGLAALTFGYILNKSHNENLNPNDFKQLNSNQINSFDRISTRYYSKNFSKASDYGLCFMSGLPLGFLSFESTRNDAAQITLLYFQTLSLSSGANLIAKNIFLRKRPFAYEQNVSMTDKIDSDTEKSFYSGHTNMAFTSAVFFSTVFSDYFPDSNFKPFVWACSLTAAATIGYMRMRAGKHFPTDIITGALMGSFFGYLIPSLHKSKTSVVFYPSFENQTNLINLSYSY